MTNYVLGFIFNMQEGYVWCVRKQHPAFQAGKLNGIGGKVETHESLFQAMQRECKEECGLDTADWDYIGDMSGPDFRVATFYTVVEPHSVPQTLTDEEIVEMPLDSMCLSRCDFVNHTPTLISACLAHMQTGNFLMDIKYSALDEKTLDTKTHV